MVRKIHDYLDVIKVSLPNSPLRDLNSYVIRSPERNLLIDTGFNQPECLANLQEGIQALGLDMDKTDILVTHLHSDHAGLAAELVRPGCRIFIGELDRGFFVDEQYKADLWAFYLEQYRTEGVPEQVITDAMKQNPAKNYAPSTKADYVPLKDGEILTVGNIRLKCIHTPGHTPGHICLYHEADKSMILGDHVLFDISPNITPWLSLRNALKRYMESLRKIQAYDVVTPLPGHRECSMSMSERIEELLAHHATRLAETYDAVLEHPGISGYEVAGQMKWSIRARNWEEFPVTQKWFAIGETLAHLYYLEENGDISRELRDGQAVYLIK